MMKIGITGHRNLLRPRQVAKQIKWSLEYFKAIYGFDQASPNLTCISAVAAGADMLFAEAAIALGIPLKIMIPFDLEDYKKDFKPADLDKLESVLKKTTDIVIQQVALHSREERNKAYLENGKKLADESDIMLAVWDGNPAGGVGGTGDIVDYVKQNNDKQLHIIKVERDDPNNKSYVADKAEARFDGLDQEAIKYKKRRFEPAWIAGIITGVLAVFTFALKQSFSLPEDTAFVLSLAEISLLFISFILLAVFAKRWKNIFLVKRRNAEYLRVLLWYRNAGMPIPAIELENNNKVDDEVLKIENELSSFVLKVEDLPNAKRVLWGLAQEQADYHQRVRIVPFSRRLARMQMWLRILKIVFFITTPVGFLLEGIHHFFPEKISPGIEQLQSFLQFTSLTLPSIYAALEGIKYFGEWKRNIAVSKKTISELEKAKTRIADCTDENDLVAETRVLREIMEIENIDWTERFDEKEIEAKP